MNLIKILTVLILFLTSAVGAQQTAPNTQVPTNVAPVNPANPINNLQQPNQQTAPKKERTEQILIDPFSGSASTASIDVNTNPDLANFVDQTLVGVIVGEKKRIAVLQSAQGQYYYKIPVTFQVKGSYIGYLKFRLALSRSNKFVNFDNEKITVNQGDKTNSVTADVGISIVGLPDEFN